MIEWGLVLTIIIALGLSKILWAIIATIIERMMEKE